MRQVRALLVVALLLLAPAALRADDEQEPPPDPAWSGNLGLSYVATGGNTDTSTLGLDFKMERRPAPWGFDITATFTRSDDEGVLTAERYTAGLRARRAFGERWEVFGGVGAEKDPFAGYDLLSLVEAGATYKALVGPRHTLSFDAGLTWTDENRVEPEPDFRYAGGLAGLAYEWKISDTASLTQTLVYYPNFEETADWRAHSNTGLTTSVSSRLAVNVGYELRYRNQPIGDRESTDRTTKVSLVLNF